MPECVAGNRITLLRNGEQYFPALVNTAGNFGNKVATQAIIPRDFERYGGVRLSLDF